ncbi:hypothetical protein DAPPUDRAFT_302626 [Daphnia pulex]|uniref:Uncharacterized protein n=1 Tax=Daphnia pulex TaxID=6669 RepID=E9GE39_DAPPU|nr:hypothetical protein DAPPUDRAFT_302626 [Daphnia pulex]|eukprot:EFX82383.1 hypothetical protein DAPPUDRAFT_302626 [Daphnia pulex]
MRQGDLITCPFCRDTFVKFDVESLPNNPYALHMLKFKEKKEEPPLLPKPVEIVTTPLAVSWCVTCGSAEKPGCAPSGHSSVNMTADIIRNLEALLKLKEELMKMKDVGTNQLTMAIEERQKVHEQLALVMKAIQSSENEIKKLQDENSFHIAQMVSVLERNKLKTDVDSQDGQKKELYFSELMSLVEGSTADDTADTLKQKMTQLVEQYEQKFNEATALVSEYELRNKMKISVHLFDENDRPIPMCSWLEKGFRYQPITPALKVPQNHQDSVLLSHVIFSALKRQKIPLKCVEQPTNASTSSTSIPLPPYVSASTSKFVLGISSLFILRLFQSGCPKGEIHIRPTLTFHPAFLQKLGEFCFKSQKKFGGNIDKALAEVCVALPMVHPQPQFQSAVPNIPQSNSIQKASKIGEVGIIFSKNTVSEWSFILPLKEFLNPKQAVHVKSESNNQLFGRVVNLQMIESVIQLSKSKKTDRACYTLTLESQ